MVAGTVCFAIIGTICTVVVIEIVRPSTDTSQAVRQVTGIINTLIGLLAGFLAGRTDYTMQNQQRGPKEKDPPQ